MLKVYTVKALLLACSLLAMCAAENFSSNDDSTGRRAHETNYDVITEKSFVQSRVLGNCCLVAAMATLPGNAELRRQAVPNGQDFTVGRGEFEFNIHKLGIRRRVAVDPKSLPQTENGTLIFSRSANDDFFGPLLEKALIDLLFEGDYRSSHMVLPSHVLCSLFNNYFEEFPSVSAKLPFEISELVEHGLKPNSPMVVEFKNRSGILKGYHCYTLLDIRDGVAEVYDPHGKHVSIPENHFYENLSTFDISFNENRVFRMPEIRTSAEFNETWPELKPREKIRFVDYDLVVYEDGTELLLNLLVAKHDRKVKARMFITDERKENFPKVIAASLVESVDEKTTRRIYLTSNSLRATLNGGRYKVVVALSALETFQSCELCPDYFENGGKEFVLRLAASKRSSVEKSLKKGAEAVEKMLSDIETNMYTSVKLF